jgi:glycosyltransferase involved in cell wall biosynthesis
MSDDAGRVPLTVLIPTYNEERNLPDCLASVTWADEVFVVDSFSSDRTVAIATAAGARVVQHAYLNSANQKNWALPQCRHRWVLIVDADERVDPELAVEIKALLAAGTPPFPAYEIRRRTYAFGHEIRRCGLQDDRVTRLFDREKCRYPELEVHADLIVDGQRSHLRGRMAHLTYHTLDDYFEKFRRYTTWSANDRWKRGDRAGFWMIATKPLARFVSMYVLKRGFLDGVPGLIYCGLGAISVMVRCMKLWAMQDCVSRDARWPEGRRIIHGGAAVLEEQEVIAGGRRGVQSQVGPTASTGT